MRPQPLTIHLRRRDHAECVAEALAAYSVNVVELEHGWDIDVQIRSSALGDVLSAIHECLQENAIPLVRITVDDRTYAMEPTPR